MHWTSLGTGAALAVLATVWASAASPPPPSSVQWHATLRAGAVQTQAAVLGPGQTLLLGNSIEEGFWWNTICGKPIVNAGSGGSNTLILRQNISTYLTLAQPRIVFVAIGINDAVAAAPFDIERWRNDYDAIVDTTTRTNAVVILETILPVEHNRPLGDLYFDTARIAQMNEHIRARARSIQGVLLVDGFAALEQNGFMPAGWTLDGVHPLLPAYQRIIELRSQAMTDALARHGEECAAD